MDHTNISKAFGKSRSEAVNLGVPGIFPFPINIPERDLIDLRTRLDLTRLPEAETVPDAKQGIELDRLKVLLDAWRQHDWRGREERWNAIPHFRTHLDGLNIAFWHVRSPEPTAIPLVLTHGWPGSVLEFEKILGQLTIQSRTVVRERTPFTWLSRRYPVSGSATALAKADSNYPHGRRLYELFRTSLENPVSPYVVGEKIHEIVESGAWKLRHPVGPDAEGFFAWRASMSDEQWVEWGAISDEQWVEYVRQNFHLNVSLEAISV